MSQFKIRNFTIRVDITIGVAVVVIMMILCTTVISRRLSANAQAAATRDASNREVLLSIVSHFNDEQQNARQMAEITIKNRELEGKLENNYEQLQDCAEKIGQRAKAKTAR